MHCWRPRDDLAVNTESYCCTTLTAPASVPMQMPVHFTYAMARSPKMESSIAQKLYTNIQIAALLICFSSVTSSICWYITETDAAGRRNSGLLNKEPVQRLRSEESTVISPEDIVWMEAAIFSHCAMIFGTSTSTRPMMISTLSVEAHFLQHWFRKSAITKINAAIISAEPVAEFRTESAVCGNYLLQKAAADAVPIMIR